MKGVDTHRTAPKVDALSVPEANQISDPLLALYGSGRLIWADEHADEYVDRLRRDWDY